MTIIKGSLHVSIASVRPKAFLTRNFLSPVKNCSNLRCWWKIGSKYKIRDSKRHIPSRNDVIVRTDCKKIGARGLDLEKRKNQKTNYPSHFVRACQGGAEGWGAQNNYTIVVKFCTGVDAPYLIIHVKFGVHRLESFGESGGGQFSPFLLNCIDLSCRS